MSVMTSLIDRLQAADVRLSAQRRIVAESLDGKNTHLTADQLLARARDRLPEIGRATVYKALAEFVSVGAVRELDLGDGTTRYDPNAHIPHQHAHCDTCGETWDVGVTDEVPTGPSGFHVDHAEILLRGRCASCND